GQVVGGTYLWDNGTRTDLNTQIDPSSGWVLTATADINDSGLIVGTGTLQGVQHCFLLVPDTITGLSINNVSVTEGNAGTVQAVFTVTRTGPTDQVTTVNFSTADGTAAAGSDYAAASGTITFNPGETTATLT